MSKRVFHMETRGNERPLDEKSAFWRSLVSISSTRAEGYPFVRRYPYRMLRRCYLPESRFLYCQISRSSLSFIFLFRRASRRISDARNIFPSVLVDQRNRLDISLAGKFHFRHGRSPSNPRFVAQSRGFYPMRVTIVLYKIFK